MYDRSIWPDEVKQFIREHASEDVTMLHMLDMVNSKFRINRDYEQIKGLYFRQKYPKKRKTRDDRTLTTEQAEYMESIIKGRRSEEVTQMMRDKYGDVITLKQVRTWKKNRRLCSGVDTRIKKRYCRLEQGHEVPRERKFNIFQIRKPSAQCGGA